jgi:hypothetical protein
MPAEDSRDPIDKHMIACVAELGYVVARCVAHDPPAVILWAVRFPELHVVIAEGAGLAAELDAAYALAGSVGA